MMYKKAKWCVAFDVESGQEQRAVAVLRYSKMDAMHHHDPVVREAVAACHVDLDVDVVAVRLDANNRVDVEFFVQSGSDSGMHANDAIREMQCALSSIGAKPVLRLEACLSDEGYAENLKTQQERAKEARRPLRRKMTREVVAQAIINFLSSFGGRLLRGKYPRKRPRFTAERLPR